MSSAGAANTGTTPVREGYTLDRAALARWMEANVQGFAGVLDVEQFAGGQSNPTYKLSARNKTYVLRRKPPGKLLKGAHAIEREAQVMAALGQTDFPVPAIYGQCDDESIIGTPFFVMEMVEGQIFWDATFPGVGNAQRPRYFDAMNAVLAQLHSIDYEAIGLRGYGRQNNYIERQIAIWSKQYLADEAAGRDPNMDALVEWLPKNIPPGDETAIVHGDLRCDNMIFAAGEPRILAVLDWELSTLGHPLADFAYNAMMYRMPPDIVAGLEGADLTALNIPSEDDFVAAYCQRTGRERIDHWEFYLAVNFFRLAAIFHGIKGRVLRGTAASKQAAERAEAFPRLARLAVEAVDNRG